MQSYAIVVHYSEIALKGKNQRDFRCQLADNLRLQLGRLGHKWRIRETMGLLEVAIPPDETHVSMDSILAELSKVFGVAWLSRAVRLSRDKDGHSWESHLESVRQYLVESARAQHAPGKTFVVRANRADKKLEFTSVQIERELGAFLIQNTPWQKVSLRKPDVTFNVDFRPEATYLYSERTPGPGGLPVGSAGRVLALLSGGIDSPVAAWLMAKRGCRVDFLHFTASALTKEEAVGYKVVRLANQLSQFTLNSRLFLVPYTYFDLALMRHKVEYELILFRRFMARVGQTLARRIKAQALVSGDNLAQVASQTLPNLVSTSQAVQMPILRPVIGFDKEEITSVAIRIGTYQNSIEPYKDCCAIIARHPRTRSRHETLTRIEAAILPDYEKIIAQTLAEAMVIELPTL